MKEKHNNEILIIMIHKKSSITTQTKNMQQISRNNGPIYIQRTEIYIKILLIKHKKYLIYKMECMQWISYKQYNNKSIFISISPLF